MVVDEIKTTRVDASMTPSNVKFLHWGQAKIYAHLLAQTHGAASVCVRLCYLQLADDSEFIESITLSANELKAFFDDAVAQYSGWLEQQANWKSDRDQTIVQALFPYAIIARANVTWR